MHGLTAADAFEQTARPSHIMASKASGLKAKRDVSNNGRGGGEVRNGGELRARQRSERVRQRGHGDERGSGAVARVNGVPFGRQEDGGKKEWHTALQAHGRVKQVDQAATCIRGTHNEVVVSVRRCARWREGERVCGCIRAWCRAHEAIAGGLE